MRALYWSVGRRRTSIGGDTQRVHIAAEALLALALIGVGLGVSRLGGARATLPVLASAERAIRHWLPVSAPAAPPPDARVDIVAAPAGRAVLVTVDHQVALIDGGPPAVGEAVVAHLRALGVPGVAVAIMTKASAGEALGLLPLLDGLTVGRIIDLQPSSSCPAHAAVLADARAHDTPVEDAAAGASFALGPARLQVAWPPAAAPASSGRSAAATAAGPGAVRLTLGGVALLFAGNVTPSEVPALRRQGAAIRAQVLEVPDGIVGDAMDPALLPSIAPRVAILAQEAGAPGQALLSQLAAARVLAVDAGESGDLSIQTDGRGIMLSLDPSLPGQGAADSTRPAAGAPLATGPCD